MLGKKKKIPADINSRRAILWMHPQALVSMMTSARWVIIDNHLPEDAQFHHVFWDAERMVWGLVVISAEYKPVKMGEKMPELKMMHFRNYDGSKDKPNE